MTRGNYVHSTYVESEDNYGVGFGLYVLSVT